MAYYQYTVKYVCGEGDNEILVKGVYRTVINIHNPYDFPQRPICWKVVSPTPDGNPTPPRQWVQAACPPTGVWRSTVVGSANSVGDTYWIPGDPQPERVRCRRRVYCGTPRSAGDPV